MTPKIKTAAHPGGHPNTQNRKESNPVNIHPSSQFASDKRDKSQIKPPISVGAPTGGNESKPGSLDSLAELPHGRVTSSRNHLSAFPASLRRSLLTRGRFERARLPDPEAFYGGRLRLHGHGRWRSALCPWHGDRTPSLRVNIETGAYRCMSCGVHGGDVLDYYRRETGYDFRSAAELLGAWS